MIRKILMFAENNGDVFNFMKSASILRLSYMLRKEGYEVKQVHNCLSFDASEIETILEKFSAGEKVLVCVSTSFISTINKKNVSELPDDEEGAAWGADTYSFFKRALPIFKRYKMPVLMGGWEIEPYKFRAPPKHNQWGIKFLREHVDFFVMGNNIDIIQKFCKGESFEYETYHDCKLVTASDIVDYTDCASTPIYSDHIFEGEALSTEIAAGCIFSCQFCNYAALGKKKTEYMRGFESFRNELVSNYNNFKTRVYLLSDNIINDYDEKLKFLIRIREELGVDIRWSGYLRLDTIKNYDQAKLIADSGVAGVTFGIESFKKETGPSIGKMTDKGKLLKSLELFRKAVGDNCIVTGSFIAGLPTETEKEVFQTYEWLQTAEGSELIDNYTFSTLTVFQGQADKNSINMSRNDPFKDYEIINKNPSHWTSPWGTSERYQELAKHFNRTRKSTINGFSIPFLHNVGIKVENAVGLGRMHDRTSEFKVYRHAEVKKANTLVEYKNKMLS
jgi:radical SAM superfamily enzyme YgiQ (UPF0313 family)